VFIWEFPAGLAAAAGSQEQVLGEQLEGLSVEGAT
jgi:hypothetical protein